jgi:glycerophosphoryl diester phosphodiesterase
LQTGALVSRRVWNARARNALETLIGQVTALGCNWLNMHRDLFTPSLPALIHAHSLKLGIWTVNTLSAMRRFASAGVDSLTSDRPDLFANLQL